MDCTKPLLLHETVEVHFGHFEPRELRDYWVSGFVTDVTGAHIAVVPVGQREFPDGQKRIVLPLPADGNAWRR